MNKYLTLVIALPLTFAGTILALDLAEYRELHGKLQANEAEPWRTIPWQIDLLAAQNAAAESNKPLFIWAMDGHPLGCT